MKIALVCGGVSGERGISLNSARSILDHLASSQIEIVPFYIDHAKKAYQISTAQLYSNTPSDFDFKLQQTATALSQASFVQALRQTDLVFSTMHGAYGEDGGFQRFLEKHRISFVGASASVCQRVFDKFTANETIRELGFYALPSAELKIFHKDHRAIIEKFFKTHQLNRAIVKPAKGGSSIGVFSVGTPEEALAKTSLIFSKRMDTRVVIEPFAQGREFTVIILQNQFGLPVALVPTEIETDYTQHQIFDFRKKYLPTRQVIWHCPPRFSNAMIEKIQVQAEQLFSALGMRDFSRFDGWVLENGEIWFSDFNPISGMEQNSFLFQQGSRIGLTHAEILRYIVRRAADRYGIFFPETVSLSKTKKRKPVHVLFGGESSERQVSVMSGTNVWLKLKKSSHYEPHAFLLDRKERVWQVPYHLALNHTAEEIADNCRQAKAGEKRLAKLESHVRLRLALPEKKAANDFFMPRAMTLSQFIHQAPFVFIALHGGIGEDGTLQARLEKARVKFNGSSSAISALCMDKAATMKRIAELNIPGVFTIPQKVLSTKALLTLKPDAIRALFKELRTALNTRTIIVKPKGDGCSSGVAHLFSSLDLEKYLALLVKRATFVPPNTFRHQPNRIELSSKMPTELLFEQFIDTDIIRIKANRLKHIKRTGWVEITIGFIEDHGQIRVLNPSVTVAEGEVLSVEEKFQGGTGVNLTPPPENMVKSTIIATVRERIQTLVKKMGLTGYARIDAFMEIKTGNLMIIEINTLPGLTPSTVLYHQALAERPSLYPTNLLEKLIENKKY